MAHAGAVLAHVRSGAAAGGRTGASGGAPGGAPADDPAGVVVDAVLPPGDDAAVRAHYEQLLAAGRVPALAAALGDGRARLDAVLAALLVELRSPVPAALALAVVDGAVVAAVSEGRPVRGTARDLLLAVLGGAEPLR